MIYEEYDELNKVKAKIQSILKMKYEDDTSEYVESDDLEADVVMNSIIKLVTNSTNELYQATLTINYGPTEANNETTAANTLNQAEATYKDKLEKEYQALLTKQEALNNVEQRLNNHIALSKAELEAIEAATFVEPVPASYNTPAKAAKWFQESSVKFEAKKPARKNKKEIDNNKILVPLQNEYEKVSKELEKMSDAYNLKFIDDKGLKDYMKTIKVDKGKGPNYRSTNLYISFAQHVYNVSKNLHEVNRHFEEIIREIGYVEPTTMNDYNEAMDAFEDMYKNFIKVTHYNNKFNIKLTESNNYVEKKEILSRIDAIKTELDKLADYNETIEHNYNYKSGNVQRKRDPVVPDAYSSIPIPEDD